jgi:hypothetical protein
MNTLLLRQWHGYLGAFIAPSVIFFALTGSIQLFNLHEAHGAYHPAPIIEKLARVHKDQVFALDHDHGPPAQGAAPAHDDDEQPAVATTLLKWFFLLVALGLVVSTSLGLWIGLTRPRGRRVTVAVLAMGCVAPLVLLAV